MTSTFKKVHAITGMKDALPDTSAAWESLEATVREWLGAYGYCNMRTPVLEHTRLFTRGIGEVTDIVEKEMYSFTDALNNEHLTMRPEFTAGNECALTSSTIAVRNARIGSTQWARCFVTKKPQRAASRPFHQDDFEAWVCRGPDIDAELIVMLASARKLLGSQNPGRVNSLGQAEERAAHGSLIEHLQKQSTCSTKRLGDA